LSHKNEVEGQVVPSTGIEGDAPVGFLAIAGEEKVVGLEELVQVLDTLILTCLFQNVNVDATAVVHCSALATLSVHASAGQKIGTTR
jgi:hypothetical protein